jgi:hypothetical protein
MNPSFAPRINAIRNKVKHTGARVVYWAAAN